MKVISTGPCEEDPAPQAESRNDAIKSRLKIRGILLVIFLSFLNLMGEIHCK
jgi:hypothetical protein